ncbi:MAG TPA: class I SAM-dependent methyltransferase [Anaerolineaceae bacterium]|jgi:2-polyprenyl-3-methyl-5-hydroxy-6-metoxy-1,4-benzoquinol methylase|nr:class I SAM-dependent methyltransferase [Anaerolineaceae bacterium]HPS32551.1 class I SAM-dependent methyltransferase [Anaerolineaceae bacterium]
MTQHDVKQEIGRFYNEVGWQLEQDGNFQNAQYEDLRPVSAEYIARAHARVARHLPKSGRYLLDAGSGPVQYDAYLQYSAGYERRVCLDLSFVALKQARARLGARGWYVVADIANLPFKPEAFDGIVSLHTIHHLPTDEKPGCYMGLYERLTPGGSMVTVDGWSEHKLRKTWTWLIRLAEKLRRQKSPGQEEGARAAAESKPAGTYVVKNNAAWFKAAVGSQLPARIFTWRSVSVHFLRTVIQPEWGGKFWLKVLYRLEECFPRYFGENGQYPLIVISKPNKDAPA